MNNIYRLVWSHVANSFIAVAEISRTGKKGGRGGRGRRKLLAAALLLSGNYISLAHADDVTWNVAYPNYVLLPPYDAVKETGYAFTIDSLVVANHYPVGTELNILGPIPTISPGTNGTSTGVTVINGLPGTTGTDPNRIITIVSTDSNGTPTTITAANIGQYTYSPAPAVPQESQELNVEVPGLDGSYQVISVYDSSTFISAGDTPVSDMVLPVYDHNSMRIFNNFGIASVASTGGQANINVGSSDANAPIAAAANTIDLLTKNSVLAKADGSGSATSRTEWRSDNYIHFRPAIVLSTDTQSLQAQSAKYDFSITLPNYEQVGNRVVRLLDKTFVINSSNDIAGVNDFLIGQGAYAGKPQIQYWLTAGATVNGEVIDSSVEAQSTYDAIITGMLGKEENTSINLTYHVWDDKGPHTNNATVDTGDLNVIYATGGNASGLVTVGGSLAVDGAKAVMRADNDAIITNNGAINAWRSSGSSPISIGMLTTDATAINNGTLNAGLFIEKNGANQNVSNAGSVGMQGSGSSTLTNNGHINVAITDTTTNNARGINASGSTAVTNAANATIAVVGNSNNTAGKAGGYGVYLQDSATFNNAGKIYLGVTPVLNATAPTAVPMTGGDLSAGIHTQSSGAVNNTGIITLESKTRNAAGISVQGATGAVTNSGTINVLGKLTNGSAAANYGLNVVDNIGSVTHSGVINVDGDNNIAINVSAQKAAATVSTTAGSSITVGTAGDTGGSDGQPYTYRNYAVYAEGLNTQHAQVNLNSTIRLLSAGAIGVHARGDAQIDINAASTLSFENTQQIGYYAWGDEAQINIGNAVITDSGQKDSILFAVDHGASFAGSTGAASTYQLTVNGQNATGIFANGLDDKNNTDITDDTLTSLDTGSAKIFVNGNGAVGVKVTGGAVGTISDGGIILGGNNTTAVVVDGRNYNIDSTIDPEELITRVTSDASTTTSSSQSGITGYNVSHLGQLTLNGTGIALNGTGSTGILLHDNGSAIVNAPVSVSGTNNIGVNIQNNGVLTNNNTISVSGVAGSGNVGLRVGGANAIVNRLGTVNATGGLAAVQLIGSGANLTVNGTGNHITASGGADGVRMDTGATSFTATNTIIDISGSGAGINNNADTSNINLNGVTINASDGPAIRTAVTFNAAGTNNTLNISGSGYGFAFMNATGNPTTGNLTIANGYTINGNGANSVGILARTAGNVSSGATINMAAGAGSAIVATDGVANTARTITNTGTINSLGAGAAVINASGAGNTTVNNSGTLLAANNTAQAILTGSGNDVVALSGASANTRGEIVLGTGNDQFSWTAGAFNGGVTFSGADGNDRATLGDVSLANVTHILSNGGTNSALTLNGTHQGAAPALLGTFSADNLAKGTNIGTGWSSLTLNGDATDARVVDNLTLSGAQAININNGATLRSGISAATSADASIHNYNVTTSGATSLLSFDGTSDQTYTGVISGTGGMERINAGKTTLLGANSYTGNTYIGAGAELALGAGGTVGSLSASSNIIDDGILTVNRSNAVALNGVISGSGAFRQIGSGVTRLGGNNTYAGTTNVEKGTLLINGVQSGTGQTTVMAGSTLGGYGTIGGDVVFQAGTTLRPGDDSRGNGTGTLTINKNLTLASDTKSQFQLGQVYVPGGPLNDLVDVKGNLTLDGVLDVALTTGGAFMPGVYRLFNYGGTLVNNVMTIGSLPPNDADNYAIQTNIARQVNLVLNFVDPSNQLQFWDGDNGATPGNHGDGTSGNDKVDGGFGYWTRQISGNSNNWTQSDGHGNAPWAQDAFAVFQGQANEVRVSNAFGPVLTSGMQFTSNGYILNADPARPDSQLQFTATNPPGSFPPDNSYEAQGATHADSYFAIRVGDGGAGADITTLINVDLVQNDLVDGNIRLLKTDPGRLILTGNNVFTGGVEVWNGTLNITNDNALGATSNSVLLKNGSTFQAGADLTTSRLFFVDGTFGGALDVYGHTFMPTGVIGGDGPLTIKDTSIGNNNGVLELGIANTYQGDTTIIGKNGTGQLTVNANTSGVFGTADSLVSLSNLALLNLNNSASAETHTFTVDKATLAFNDTAGAGQSTIKLANGSKAIFSDESQGDNTKITVDASSTLALEGNADAGSANVNNSGKVTFADNAQGAGSVISNLVGGLVDISSSLTSASVGSLSGAGNVVLGAATLVEGALSRNDTISGMISGSGNLAKTGSGTLNLTANNTWTGTTTAQQGVLLINGNQVAATGKTTVNNGATLGGAGVLGGSVVVDDGGHLAAGKDLSSVGVLTMGALTLNQNSQVDFQFGQPYTVGGALNDLININGDLNLNGKLNIAQTPGGSFDVGVYRVFNYTGALTDNILDIGSAPPAADDLYVQTSIAGQVNLVNRTGYVMRFWDGFGGTGGALKNNGEIDGGNGIWQSGSGNDNWTTDVTTPDGRFNTPFSDGSFAVFGGTAGNVTIDTSLGEVAISGAQFATDGYVIGGDNLTTHTANTVIRVGDGTAPSAGYTATINSVIDGEGGINKADLGTLILNGNNQYQGGTQVSGGVLQVSSDSNLGAAGTGIGLSGGTLRYGAAFDTARQVTLSGVGGAIDTNGNSVSLLSAVTGNGDFTKLGKGTLTLTQDSSFAGLTTISDGVLQLGNGGTAGNVGGNIVDNATLAINRADTFTLNGDISGTGRVWQQGSGTTIINGSNTWSGITLVEKGTLLASGENRFSQKSSHIVSSGATLDTGGYSQSVANTVNQGTINLRGGDVGSTFTVNGNYVGVDGTLKIAAQQHSPGVADRLVINGGTASGSTFLDIDVSQLGEPTTGDGIMVVDAVNGATTTAQTTKDAFNIGGDVLTAGAWEYQLFAGNAQGAGEDWFLRAGYRPDVPGFDTLAAIIRQADLTVLGTLHQRVGDEQLYKADVPEDQEGRFWARYIVKSVDQKHDDPTQSQSSTNYNGMQMGLDLWQNEKWRAGLYTTFMDTDSSISGITGMSGGDAYNSTFSSYLGGYGTWTDTNGLYVDNVLQYGYHSVDLKNMYDRETYHPDGNSFTASVEVGKPWQLGDSNWLIEPQAQLIYQYSDFDDVTLKDRGKTKVSVNADGSVIGRLGVRLAADYDTNYGKVKPYVRVNYWQELSDGQDTVTWKNTANNAAATDINANQRFQTTEVAVGTTWAVTADVQGYTEIGKTWDGGGDTSVSSDVSASVGMKIRF
ncbi:autotransporter-associated beta strand repeat-containing protein [Buttiauxella sp. S04-F03]|uniref:autotransporter-associated beta strand repeat-containing protein n=1 Tax=Buttiauxella sp. W03-F01 TaxID=2904524 RepID=UPI001E44FC36|nr:autotransporter-associated beta strand repeat-containing protein [Buttiauxella sp. W03-F01]MCE0800219.1 autotransporter-associated beta strand repeat-containing protein [Buttiauxella sp. W03-F01]